MILPSVFVNGQPVRIAVFEHPHATPNSLFVEVFPESPLVPNDEILWSGELPEGKTRLWVRYPCVIHGIEKIGHGLLGAEDRQ